MNHTIVLNKVWVGLDRGQLGHEPSGNHETAKQLHWPHPQKIPMNSEKNVGEYESLICPNPRSALISIPAKTRLGSPSAPTTRPTPGWERWNCRHLHEKTFWSFSPPSGSCLPFFHQPETPKKKLKLHAFHVESLKNTFHLKEAGLVSYQNISPFARIIRSTPWFFSCLQKFEVLPIFFKVF